MHKIWSLFFILFIYDSAIGQLPDWDETGILDSSKIAALYLQTDRNVYLSGDTIWAKGYFTNNQYSSSPAYSLTVELAGVKEKTALLKQTFLVSRNAAAATIILPKNLETGTYIISAYSQEMLQQQEVVFTKLVDVYNIFDKEEFALSYKKKFSFYPEGGHLIAGDTNRVAFLFTDEFSKSPDITGNIINSAGTLICPFSSTHNGMGVFFLNPKLGESYFAVIDNDLNTKYPLPNIAGKGVALTVKNDSSKIEFSVRSYFSDSLNRPAFLALQAGVKKIYSASIEKSSALFKGVIAVHDAPSGVARLSVFNKDTLLLAERLCFIDNKEYVLPAKLTVSLLNKDYRAENLFSLNLNESAQGTFAVSVTNASLEEPDAETQNIYSSILLTGYLKNRVYNAGKYFDGSYKKSKELLDLVMLTNFWKGRKWEDGNSKLVNEKIEKGALTGKVLYKKSGKPYINSSVILVAISEEDSTTKTIIFTTDAAGAFKTSTINLFGENKLLFSAADKNKKDVFIDVVLDPPHQTTITPYFPEIVGTKKITNHHPGSVYDSLIKARGYMENVILKSKSKRPIQILEQRYATGLFQKLNGKVYDLTKVKDKYGNILDYLMTRYVDIKVALDDRGGYTIKVRSLTGTTFEHPILYLNETQLWDNSPLFVIKPNDVAMIKILHGMDFGEKGGAPTIAIYTRKGRDFTAANNNYDIEYYNGFSKPATFHKPVYSSDKSSATEKDSRITLLWNPKAATSKRIHFIPIHFYNNDFTKVFKVVVEGITTDGRLLYFEKKL